MKILPPLKNFYANKRRECYESVRSFKYPFTQTSYFASPIFGKITGWFTDLTTTVRLYEMSYVAVRTIDDIADETDPESGFNHLQHIVEFLTTNKESTNNSEALLQYILDASALLGRDTEQIRSAFEHIFTAVRDDAGRRLDFQNGTVTIRDEKQIEQYVYDMEYQGIFKLIFTLYNEPNKHWEQFWPLVKAGRMHFYLLRDVVEDVANGLVNIPIDYLPNDLDAFAKSAEKLEQHRDKNMRERLHTIKQFAEQNPSIKPWIKQEIIDGKLSLQKYRLTSHRGLSLKTKILLRGSYQRTNKFFRQAEKILL